MGDKKLVEILDLALCCLSCVKSVPGESDHPEWTTRMKELWHLSGVDEGAQSSSLDWGVVEKSHKQLAIRLHPDKLIGVLNQSNSRITGCAQTVLGGVWSQVQQKYEECRSLLRGGPVLVAPITAAEARMVVLPKGRGILVICRAVDTDIPLDADIDRQSQTSVRVYFPGKSGNDDRRCLPMKASKGFVSVSLSDEDYPWLFVPATWLRLVRTNEVGVMEEAHLESFVKPAPPP